MSKLNKYETNVYQWMKRKGLANKYEHAGIYCIKLDDRIVYVGKSINMLQRIAQHYVGIKTDGERKYRIISEAQRKGHSVAFDVLYNAKATSYSLLEEELGSKEGEYIRALKPLLNFQIPKEEDWRKWETNTMTTEEILNILL